MDMEIIAIELNSLHNYSVVDILDIVEDIVILKTHYFVVVVVLVILVVKLAVVVVMPDCYNSYIVVEELKNVVHDLMSVVVLVVNQKTHCMVPEVVLDKAMSGHLKGCDPTLIVLESGLHSMNSTVVAVPVHALHLHCIHYDSHIDSDQLSGHALTLPEDVIVVLEMRAHSHQIQDNPDMCLSVACVDPSKGHCCDIRLVWEQMMDNLRYNVMACHALDHLWVAILSLLANACVVLCIDQ